MPELPEVETTRRGIAPHITGQEIKAVIVRNPRLRWPVPEGLGELLRGTRVTAVNRRGKYLLLDCGAGHLILHLGMSGSLRVLTVETAPGKHDHVDIVFGDGRLLRLRDPRRFGAVLWTSQPVETHVLLRDLGVEPLNEGFDGKLLHRLFKDRQTAIKLGLMDAHLIVGVGNIYANESLFHAGIRPDRPAGSLSRARCDRLAQAIRDTLERALAAGGSTLRDFVHSDGQQGYFQQQYFVYGRAEAPCFRCGSPIRMTRMGNRSTFFCATCQR